MRSFDRIRTLLHELILPTRLISGAGLVCFLPWVFITSAARSQLWRETLRSSPPSSIVHVLGRPIVLLSLALPCWSLALWRPCVVMGLEKEIAHDQMRSSDEQLSPKQLLDRKCRQGLMAVCMVAILMSTYPWLAPIETARPLTRVPVMPVILSMCILVGIIVARLVPVAKRSLTILDLWKGLYVLIVLTFWLVSYGLSGDAWFLPRRATLRRDPETSFRYYSAQVRFRSCKRSKVTSRRP